MKIAPPLEGLAYNATGKLMDKKRKSRTNGDEGYLRRNGTPFIVIFLPLSLYLPISMGKYVESSL